MWHRQIPCSINYIDLVHIFLLVLVFNVQGCYLSFKIVFYWLHLDVSIRLQISYQIIFIFLSWVLTREMMHYEFIFVHKLSDSFHFTLYHILLFFASLLMYLTPHIMLMFVITYSLVKISLSTSFTFSPEDTAEDHGECVYQHTSGANIKVYVTESEGERSLPSNHSF